MDTTTAGNMFVFHVFAALAEFIRTIIVANTNEGLAAARARGQRLGRPSAMTPEKVAYARQLLAEPERSISALAKLVGVSRSTIYKVLPELLPPQVVQQRHAAQIATLPAGGDAVRAVATPTPHQPSPWRTGHLTEHSPPLESPRPPIGAGVGFVRRCPVGGVTVAVESGRGSGRCIWHTTAGLFG
ncbi:helix-turn-helix domain-containing protein, partial [Micromonospora sp. KC207]|uniref:helix-turn-helix domain-containing protein n=1 Tax=Micromonospora sp. KC207 TaxID=2530377 RepID=UPI0027386DD5